MAEGSYDFVVQVLRQLDVDGFFLEYDDARSGGFEPLRFVPKGKLVVLGLVTTKRPELESKDALKRRVEEASRYVDGDQICLSPQCGFSSTVEGNALTRRSRSRSSSSWSRRRPKSGARGPPGTALRASVEGNRARIERVSCKKPLPFLASRVRVESIGLDLTALTLPPKEPS